MNQNADELADLAQRARLEFGDVADFIWKTPRLIESETKTEVEKLRTYYPTTGDCEKDLLARGLRKLRWNLEAPKLEHVFPYLMSTGNLFIVAALFESYCLMLCAALEKTHNVRVSDIPGVGISRFFKFLSRIGIDLETVPLRQQVQIGLKVRNCLPRKWRAGLVTRSDRTAKDRVQWNLSICR